MPQNCSSFITSSKEPLLTLVISNDVFGKWIEFDVTTDILAFLNCSLYYRWVIMKSDDVPGRINIAAKETQTNIPRLELIFA